MLASDQYSVGALPVIGPSAKIGYNVYNGPQ